MAQQQREMDTLLFYYRRKAKITINGEEKEFTNDNFINPMQIVSGYWEYNAETQQNQLNLFVNSTTTDGSGGAVTRRIIFPEGTGKQCVLHLENFLRLVAGVQKVPPAPVATRQRTHTRTPLDIVEDPTSIVEEVIPGVPAWEA